jgi:hypothetical protein
MLDAGSGMAPGYHSRLAVGNVKGYTHSQEKAEDGLGC